MKQPTRASPPVVSGGAERGAQMTRGAATHSGGSLPADADLRRRLARVLALALYDERQSDAHLRELRKLR